jgi:hypothetical protein
MTDRSGPSNASVDKATWTYNYEIVRSRRFLQSQNLLKHQELKVSDDGSFGPLGLWIGTAQVPLRSQMVMRRLSFWSHRSRLSPPDRVLEYIRMWESCPLAYSRTHLRRGGRADMKRETVTARGGIGFEILSSSLFLCFYSHTQWPVMVIKSKTWN